MSAILFKPSVLLWQNSGSKFLAQPPVPGPYGRPSSPLSAGVEKKANYALGSIPAADFESRPPKEVAKSRLTRFPPTSRLIGPPTTAKVMFPPGGKTMLDGTPVRTDRRPLTPVSRWRSSCRPPPRRPRARSSRSRSYTGGRSLHTDGRSTPTVETRSVLKALTQHPKRADHALAAAAGARVAAPQCVVHENHGTVARGADVFGGAVADERVPNVGVSVRGGGHNYRRAPAEAAAVEDYTESMAGESRS